MIYRKEIFLFFILFLLLFINFYDFIFYSNGVDVYLMSIFSVCYLSYLCIKPKKYLPIKLLIFIILIFLLQSYSAYYFTDMVVYISFLFSGVFIFIYTNNLTNRSKKGALRIIYIFLLIVLLFSILELLLKRYGISEMVILKYSLYIRKSNQLSGIVNQSNLNAALLNCGLMLTLYYYFRTEGRRNKILMAFAYFSFTYISILTQSRAGTVAYTVIILIFLIKYHQQLSNNSRRALVSFIIFYLILLFLNDGSTPLTKHIYSLTESSTMSADSRINIWFSQILMFLDNPIFGVGLDSFKYLNNPYQSKSLELLHLPLNNILNFTLGHNELLQILSEGGVIVFIPLLYLIFQFFKRIRYKIRCDNFFMFAPIFIIFIQAMFSWQLRYPLIYVLFFSLIGISLDTIGNESSCDLSRGYLLLRKVVSFVILIGYIIFIFSFSKAIFSEVLAIREYKKANIIVDKVNILDSISENPYLYWFANANITHLIFKDLYNKCSIPINKEDFFKFSSSCSWASSTELFKIAHKKLLDLTELHKIWMLYSQLGYLEILRDDIGKAKYYAGIAIELKPDDTFAWQVLHYANVLLAAEKTGKSPDNFLPSEADIIEFKKTRYGNL